MFPQMSGVIRLSTELGDRFHYAKVLARNPYAARRIVGSMRDTDLKIHTIQCFSKESDIEKLM